MQRKTGWWGFYFISRERFTTDVLDYYPPELIVYEYLSVYHEMFTSDDFWPYRRDGVMYIDITLPPNCGFDVKPYIVDDLAFCKYELLSAEQHDGRDVLTFRSTVQPDYSLLPVKLYFYCMNLDEYAALPEQTFYDAEHIRENVSLAYEHHLRAHYDYFKQCGVYEIPFECTNAVESIIDSRRDGTYASFGPFDVRKATLISDAETYMKYNDQ